jgi:hypothetical protein
MICSSSMCAVSSRMRALGRRPRRLDPVHPRHDQVHEDDIGFEAFGEFDRVAPRGSGADDLELGILL